jgi:D-methionine transport system permease protein
MLHVLLNALEETLFMIFAAGMLAFILGLPLAVLQVITRPKHLWPNTIIHNTLTILMHSSFSIPYLIVMLALIPLIHHTAMIEAGSEGVKLEGNCVIAILPLALAVIPVFVRECTKAMNHLSLDLIDTARSFGASIFKIITKVLLPESSSGIIHAVTIMLTHLVGYSVVAGVIGAGGLGELFLNNDQHVLNGKILFFVGITIVIFTQIIQRMGNYLAFKKSRDGSS